MTPRPDFFLVGAFKSGTTALYDQLRRHRQVFMPFHKEPLFFGDDLTRRYGRLSQAEYLRLFRDARQGQRVGEASSWYLYSTSAAREIRDFAPDAQILVLLRNPVDVIDAQHGQLLFDAIEDIADLEAALVAEPERRAGRRLPHGPIRVEPLFYRHSVRFAEQLERYLEAFGPERVHVMLHDDLARDGTQVMRGCLEFLGVDASLAAAPPRANESRRVRSPLVQRLIFAPRPLLSLAPLLRRSPAVRALRERALALNSTAARRPPLDPRLRRRLTDELAPEIERLGRLIGRDLSAWLDAESGIGAAAAPSASSATPPAPPAPRAGR